MNVYGIWAIYRFEMARAIRTLWQSLVTPVITTSLYFVVFGGAIGSRMTEVDGVPYGAFIVPGLIMLSLFTQSIFNASFGIFFPKFIGTIYELLSAPISPVETVIGYVGAAATKSIVLGLVILGTAAGFALEVMVWKGRNTVLLLILGGIMIPGQMILLPLFTVYYNVGVTGTLIPLIITYTATGLPLTTFMMATYFRAIPREVFEASTIDGASILRSFWSIGFPLIRNAIVTVALVQFFLIWNDLLIAITFADQRPLNTVQAGLLNFSGDYGSKQYGPLLAAVCITVGGILVIYLFLNQRIMKGLTAGTLKG